MTASQGAFANLGDQRREAIRIRALEFDLGPELVRVAALQLGGQRVRQRLRAMTGGLTMRFMK